MKTLRIYLRDSLYKPREVEMPIDQKCEIYDRLMDRDAIVRAKDIKTSDLLIIGTTSYSILKIDALQND